MKTIPITRGLVALVDDGDYEWLNQWKWCALKARYAYRRAGPRTAYKVLLMHREIVGAQSGQYVDHINRNPLDNQRVNLRLATMSQNISNSWRSDNTSGYRGVHYDKSKRSWAVGIQVLGKKHFLGRFKSPTKAARAYDRAALKHFGEFARLNFPRTDYGT